MCSSGVPESPIPLFVDGMVFVLEVPSLLISTVSMKTQVAVALVGSITGAMVLANVEATTSTVE